MKDNMPIQWTVKPLDIAGQLDRHPTKKYKKRTFQQVNKIVVHCTDRDWKIEELVTFDLAPNHVSKDGCAAITYHDVVMKDGTVYHTLPYTEISTHAGGYNTNSVAITLMYRVCNPDTGRDTYSPTHKALKALQGHCGRLCLQFGLTPDRIFAHRELKGTGWFFLKGHKRLRKTCPGLQVHMKIVRDEAAKYMQLVLKTQGFYAGKIDGRFGKISKSALAKYKKHWEI